MSAIFKEVVVPPTLLDYIEQKQESMRMIEQAFDLLDAAEKKMDSIARYAFPREIKSRESLEWVNNSMNRRLWRTAFDQTGFMQLMDEKAVREFEQSLDKAPPEFNEDNIRSIFLTAAQDKDEMFARGLVRVLGGLSDSYRTNKDRFKVTEKAVMQCMIGNHMGYKTIGYSFNDYAGKKLNDIDRVFKTLAGEKHIPRSLESALNESLRKDEVFEDDYYKIKGFKNGNLHIQFKRPDLIHKANKVIHEYFDGLAVGRYKEAK